MGTEEKTMETEEAADPKEATNTMNGTNATNVSNTPNAAGTAKAAETTESIKTMKSIYLEKDNSMEHFIGSFNTDGFTEIANTTASIAKSAFAHSDVEQILFKNCVPDIGEKAFEGCESLATVIFGELGKDEMLADKDKSILKNLTLSSAGGNFTIQANAFKDCAKLATLVLPEVNGMLAIEKDAFCGCGSLRTVVAICDTIDFAGNPFSELGDYLTFICKKDSGVARFARENGYRSVYVD